MQHRSDKTAELEKSYRGRFPFRIATTSYIYPDRIAPNLRALAPFVDEVEVLLFEKSSPPSADEIREVAAVLDASGLTVNVHLPLDAALAAEDAKRRRADVRLVRQLIDQTRPWHPTSYCLHITPAPADTAAGGLDRWRRRAADALAGVLDGPPAPQRFTVETLDYPFAWAEPLVEDFGLSVCADLGHLFVHGFDPMPLFERHRRRITVIHLHGVAGGKDHLPLDRIESAFAATTRRILDGFSGVVSLEVFSFGALAASLRFLEGLVEPQQIKSRSDFIPTDGPFRRPR